MSEDYAPDADEDEEEESEDDESDDESLVDRWERGAVFYVDLFGFLRLHGLWAPAAASFWCGRCALHNLVGEVVRCFHTDFLGLQMCVPCPASNTWFGD